MKHGSLLCFGFIFAGVLCVSLAVPRADAQSPSKPAAGKLSGVVRDAGGVPQLGASVIVVSESPGITAAEQFLTNTQGFFRGDKMSPGLYTVRVTLAGFLPSLEKHVRISSNMTTVVRIRMESMFASIEQLRRAPANPAPEADDWKYVLRSAPGLRPVLQWADDDSAQIASAIVFDHPNPRPKARLEMTNGARRPGSVSNVASAPGTAFAYDQAINRANHIVFAGQVSYGEDAPAGGIAAIWLPTGSFQGGPQSTIVLREAKIGPDGPIFRGMRLDQSGTVALGQHLTLNVGGEYVFVGVGESASSLRPRLKLEARLSPNWYVDAVYASLPNGLDSGNEFATDLLGKNPPQVLTTALDQLDAFPALLWRNGHPVLESGRHEEFSAERKIGARGVLQAAAFHDDDRHVALFGRGGDLPSAEYFQDFYSKGFAYDGGSSGGWGTRLAWRQEITDDLEITAIYAYAGALAPSGEFVDALRDSLHLTPRHSLAAKVSTKLPRMHTQFSLGYKWVNGAAVSRVDPYGEASYQVNPFLHLGIRQPLPKFALGRWEANAECDNLLAQGYFSLNSRDGQMLLVPAFRSFRGGLSLQF